MERLIGYLMLGNDIKRYLADDWNVKDWAYDASEVHRIKDLQQRGVDSYWGPTRSFKYPDFLNLDQANEPIMAIVKEFLTVDPERDCEVTEAMLPQMIKNMVSVTATTAIILLFKFSTNFAVLACVS
jgi:hypothetical protein